MIKLAPRFGMSDVALRKRCHNHEIPTPGAGYWAQIAAGQRPKKLPLPQAEAHLEHLVFQGRSVPVEISKASIPSITVASKLSEPHAIVSWLNEALRHAKTDQHGRLKVGDGYYPNARISKASSERALRIIDALSKTLEERGHEVSPGSRFEHSMHEEMLLNVFDETISLRIEEKLDRTDHVLTADERREQQRAEKQGWGTWFRAPKYDYAPNGRLKLSVGYTHHSYTGRKSWSDTATQRLEDLLGQAAVALEAAAEQARWDRLEQERLKREHRDAERKRLRAERLAHYHRKLNRELERLSGVWKKSAQLREFLAAYEGALPADRRTARDEAWFAAATSYAMQLDPLTAAASLAKDLEPDDEELERLVGAKVPADDDFDGPWDFQP